MRLWTKNAREAIDNFAKILGVRPSERALKPQKRRAPVSITELSIMDALVDDSKVPFGELLRSTGLSPKTVRNHLNLLLETKTITVDPFLDARDFEALSCSCYRSLYTTNFVIILGLVDLD